MRKTPEKNSLTTGKILFAGCGIIPPPVSIGSIVSVTSNCGIHQMPTGWIDPSDCRSLPSET